MKQNVRDLEFTLKAIANRRRLTILQFLRGQKAISVGEIAEKLHVSFQSASQHLRTLERAGFIEGEKSYNVVQYRLRFDAPFTKEIFRQL